MYKNLKIFRESLNMTQKEFAASLGIGQTTYNGYETGSREPKSNFWVAVAEKYHVTIDYLMGYSDNPHGYSDAPKTLSGDFRHGETKKAPLWSSEAEQVARDYDSLDSWGRRAVRNTLDFELVRTKEDRRLLDMEEDEEPKVIPLFLSPAAAGVASPILGEEYDDYTLGPEDPPGAMFAVRIQGDSMEPYFPDGSLAFCNKDGLRDGDVGVFALDGGTVCKQYYKDPAGTVYLFSLNRDRADADVLLMPHSGRNLVCLGRVLTKQRFPIPGRA